MAGTETATFVSDLDAARPAGSESAQYGDDHLRLIKSTLKATLPDGSRPVRDVRTIAVSTNITVSEASHDDAFLAVDTISAPVTLTVDNTGSGTWVFMYGRVAGTNGITVKRLSDITTVFTGERGIILVSGATVKVLTEVLDASVTPSKLDRAGAYSMASLALSGAMTADSATIANSVSASTGAFSTGLTRGGNTVWDDGNFAARIAALTENTAPAGTEMVACDDGKKVSITNISNIAGGSPDFESVWIAFQSNTSSISVAHGLGATPTRLEWALKCVSADQGFNPGEIIFARGGYGEWHSIFWADATNVYKGAGSYGLYIYNKSGSRVSLKMANWSIKFFAWK